MTALSRRSFLQSLGLAGTAWMLPQQQKLMEKAWGQALAHWDGSPLGRMLWATVTAYSEPDWRSDILGVYKYNEVVAVMAVAEGYGLYPSNNNYLQTEKGYIYSSWVQPCGYNAENPLVPIGEGGAWGEITIPIAYSKSEPDDTASDRERLYYAQVQRILGVEGDYYLVGEIYGNQFWLKSNIVRIIPPEEVAPIAGDVDPASKWIDISIKDQRLFAWQGDEQVFETLVATGLPGTPTPMYTFDVFDKRHGQRMTGGLTGGGYNLPGIPYISYITKRWVAMHGCYWHNDYGRRHSNGCINMMPNDAKWIFRWTTPTPNYFAYNSRSDDPGALPGTKVVVRW